MKFRNYLEGITGVDIYPLFSLILFFGFFTMLALWAINAGKDYIDTMKNLPFGKEEDK